VGNRPPPNPPLFRRSIGSKNALFWQQCFFFTHVSLRHVTSLGHQGVRRVFWEVPKVFELCPIVLDFVQHIFPGEAKNFQGAFPLAPLITILASFALGINHEGQTCSMEESLAENQKHRRAEKPVCSVNQWCV